MVLEPTLHCILSFPEISTFRLTLEHLFGVLLSRQPASFADLFLSNCCLPIVEKTGTSTDTTLQVVRTLANSFSASSFARLCDSDAIVSLLLSNRLLATALDLLLAFGAACFALCEAPLLGGHVDTADFSNRFWSQMHAADFSWTHMDWLLGFVARLSHHPAVKDLVLIHCNAQLLPILLNGVNLLHRNAHISPRATAASIPLVDRLRRTVHDLSQKHQYSMESSLMLLCSNLVACHEAGQQKLASLIFDWIRLCSTPAAATPILPPLSGFMRRILTQFLLEEGRILVVAKVLPAQRERREVGAGPQQHLAAGTQVDIWHPLKGVGYQQRAFGISLQSTIAEVLDFLSSAGALRAAADEALDLKTLMNDKRERADAAAAIGYEPLLDDYCSWLDSGANAYHSEAEPFIDFGIAPTPPQPVVTFPSASLFKSPSTTNGLPTQIIDAGLEMVETISASAGLKAKEKRSGRGLGSRSARRPASERSSVSTKTVSWELYHSLLPGVALPSQLRLSQLINMLQCLGYPSGLCALQLAVERLSTSSTSSGIGSSSSTVIASRAEGSDIADTTNQQPQPLEGPLAGKSPIEVRDCLLHFDPFPSLLDSFAGIGGLSLLAENLQTQLCLPAPPLTPETFHISLWRAHAALQRCPIPLPPASLITMVLCLRIPDYSKRLLRCGSHFSSLIIRALFGMLDPQQPAWGDASASASAGDQSSQSSLATTPFSLLTRTLESLNGVGAGAGGSSSSALQVRLHCLESGVLACIMTALAHLAHFDFVRPMLPATPDALIDVFYSDLVSSLLKADSTRPSATQPPPPATTRCLTPLVELPAVYSPSIAFPFLPTSLGPFASAPFPPNAISMPVMVQSFPMMVPPNISLEPMPQAQSTFRRLTFEFYSLRVYIEYI